MSDLAHRSPETEPALGDKVVQMRRAMHDRAEALGGWAQTRARSLRTTAGERPLAVAGVSAGAAFAAGLVVGMLLLRAAPEALSWGERSGWRRIKTPW